MASSGSKAYSKFRENFGEGESTEEDSEELDLTVYSAVDNKSGTQAENKRRCRGFELDADIWSELDDHLREKIIARLPFRSLFQVSSLSKDWRLRFRSTSFQSEVDSSAASWSSYGPMFVNHSPYFLNHNKDYVPAGKTVLVGYDNSSQRWHRLPTHLDLPQDLGWDWNLRGGDGSLFLWIGECLSSLSYPLLVANPLSKSWKQLPPRPNMKNPKLLHVVREGSKTYKVILGSIQCTGRVGVFIQVYDSTDGSWTMEFYCTEGNANHAYSGGSAVIDEVLYILVCSRGTYTGNKYTLISFDVNEKIFRESPLLYQDFDEDEGPHQFNKFFRIRLSNLFVCGSNLMLVIYHVEAHRWDNDDEGKNRGILSVFKIDLEHRLAIEVSRAPTGKLSSALDVAACHGDCIYIGSHSPYHSSIYYNVRTQVWHWFNSAPDILLSVTGTVMPDWHWMSMTYQPGLHPFLKL